MTLRRMSWSCALATALLFSVAAPAAAADSFASPPPRKIEQLEREHLRQPWYVSTSAERYLVRVGRVGPDGLAGLSPTGRTPVPPAIGWGEIARIERRTSRRAIAGIAGATVGAVALGFVGAAVGEAASTPYRSYNDHGAWIGIASGLLSGAVFGSILGERQDRTEALYVGAPVDAGNNSREPATQAPTSALERTRPFAGQSLSVRGSFGLFVGRVRSITPEGLSGLEPDPALDSRLPLPPEPIRWSQISRIERLGNHTGRGALIGALVVGGLGAALGGAIASSSFGLSNSGGSDEDIAGGIALGGVAGGAVGGLLGALFGYKFPGWHLVYRGTEAAATSPGV